MFVTTIVNCTAEPVWIDCSSGLLLIAIPGLLGVLGVVGGVTVTVT